MTRAPRLGPMAGAVTAAVLATLLAASGILRFAELPLRDAFLRWLPRRGAVSVAAVVVDEASLRDEGPWPWPRARLASLLDAVGKAGARGVVVDLLLPEARDGDLLLAGSLGRVPSVLAAGIAENGGWLLPAPTLRGAATLAHVAFEPDGDGVVRRISATRQAGGLSLPALSLAAALLREPERPIPVGAFLLPGFRASGRVPVVSASVLLHGKEVAPLLGGRVVFVGASAAGIGDRVVWPLSPNGSPEPGVLIQATATESILAGDLLDGLPPFVAGALALAAAFLVSAAGSTRGSSLPLASAAALSPLALEGVAVLAGYDIPSVAAALPVAVLAAVRQAFSTARVSRETAAVKRRVEELSNLADSLEVDRQDASEARRVVAHELRTPLTSVRGLAQLLADFDLSEDERRRVAGLVASETRRLSEMVEGLLDLERLKLREFATHSSVVDLSSLVAGRAAVLGSGGRLRPSIEKGLAVQGDPGLLARLVDNLVGNAFKFSPEPEPVDLSLRAVSRDAVLEVLDRGPGIPPAERALVFRRFARGSTASSAQGLGLGLAMVSEVTRWHRGTVALEAPPSGGSLFKVIIPMARGGRT